MDYPSNKPNPEPEKAEPKKVERVVEGKVVRRKKPLGKRLKEWFVIGNIKEAATNVWFTILIPAARDMVVDAGQELIHRTFNGGDSRHKYKSSSNLDSGLGHVAYGERYIPSSSKKKDEHRHLSHKSRSLHDFDEIILPTRREADNVLDRLFHRIEKYGSTSVSDLYDMVGVSADFTDEKYGWIDFRGARVDHVRNGYLLNLPKPELLD